MMAETLIEWEYLLFTVNIFHQLADTLKICSHRKHIFLWKTCPKNNIAQSFKWNQRVRSFIPLERSERGYGFFGFETSIKSVQQLANTYSYPEKTVHSIQAKIYHFYISNLKRSVHGSLSITRGWILRVRIPKGLKYYDQWSGGCWMIEII